MVGGTQSLDFPVTAGARPPEFGSGDRGPGRFGDGFIAWLDRGGAGARITSAGGRGAVRAVAVAASPDGGAVAALEGGSASPCEPNSRLLVFDADRRFESSRAFPGAVGDVAADSAGSYFAAGRADDSTIAPYVLTADAALDAGRQLARKLDLRRDAEEPTIDCLVNAASSVSGRLFGEPAAAVIAPGEIITLFGPGLAGEDPSTLELRINDQPAEILFAEGDQINAFAPFNVPTGEASVSLSNDLGATRRFSLEVAGAVPGVFAHSRDGRGQVVALNEDGSLNGPEHPAARGEVVSIFAAGLGPLTFEIGPIPPTPVDPVERLVYPVEAFIVASTDTRAAGMEILRAGRAEGFPDGVYRVDARVPELAQSGSAGMRLISAFEGEQSPLTVWLTIE